MALRTAPKYSDLPGIDTEADVFETTDNNDQSNENQESVNEEFNNEEIESINVDSRNALKCFSGMYLDSGRTDFSDNIGRKKKKGYDVATEYEILGEGAHETAFQKYQRLQHELNELAEHLEQIKNKKEDEKHNEKLSSVMLGTKVNSLQKQLQDLEIEKVLGPETLSSTGTPQGGLPKRLVNEIESYKTEIKKDKSKEEQPRVKPGCVTYELFYKQEHAKFSEISKMSELEERLQKLENTLGHKTPQMGVITSELSTEDKTLLAAVSSLKSKLSLLDFNHIEHIDARLQGVLHHISQLEDKKSEITNAEKQAKVAELYDLVSKWDAVIGIVPDLTNRLHSLKTLHQQATEFSQVLSHLDGAQSDLTSQVQDQSARLKLLDENFVENLSIIESNCSKMETRIENLVKKFGKK